MRKCEVDLSFQNTWKKYVRAVWAKWQQTYGDTQKKSGNEAFVLMVWQGTDNRRQKLRPEFSLSEEIYFSLYFLQRNLIKCHAN